MFLVWAVGGVVALAGALTYAELGAMMPDAGGAYVYIREGFGGLPAFLYGWMALLSIGTGALAAVALGFAGYAGRFMNLAPFGGPLGVAAATIAVLTAHELFRHQARGLPAERLRGGEDRGTRRADRGRLRVMDEARRSAAGAERAAAARLARVRVGDGVRRGAVHDRRLAANEHGGGRDSRIRRARSRARWRSGSAL